MFGEHHDLAHDFPEYKDRIHRLKLNDPEFAQLFKRYQEVDKEIYRIAQQIETPSDIYTEELKKKRVWLKDQLYAMLQSVES